MLRGPVPVLGASLGAPVTFPSVSGVRAQVEGAARPAPKAGEDSWIKAPEFPPGVTERDFSFL